MFNDDFIVVDLENPIEKYSPISPFMSVLKKQNLTEQQVEPYTYSLQKNSFLSYLESGKTEFRNDVYVIEELFYEKKRCLQTIYDLFTKYVSKPIVILNAQELKEEAIKLINLFNENSQSKENKFLLCFDFISSNIDLDSNVFFTEVAESSNYLDISNYFIEDEELKSKKSDAKEIIEFDVLHNFFANSINFLSLDSAICVAENYLKNTIDFMFTIPQTRKLYLQISLLYLYANRFDDAANLLNSLLDDDSNDEIEEEVLFFMGQLLYAKSAFQDSLKYVTMVRNKNTSGKNSTWYILSSMVYYMIIQKNDSKRAEEEYFRILRRQDRPFDFHHYNRKRH
jgi:hypothetical protein